MQKQITRKQKQKSLYPITKHIRQRIQERTRSKRKHWDLYRYLWNPYLLSDALDAIIKNGGSSGLDGQSIEQIKKHRGTFVKELSEELKSGDYHPTPTKRIYIPKKDGKQRPLSIPTIKDRVVQRALCFLMEGIYEERFQNFSYGFRPHRRAVDCAAQVAKEAYKLRFILEADIEAFFDRVSHKKLLKMLENEIADPRLMKLVARYLKVGFQEFRKPWQGTHEGTPQGGPLSPLLSNIYLHYCLDEKFQEAYGTQSDVKMARYADDFVILCRSAKAAKQLENIVRQWLHAADLNVKESKTRIINMTNENRGHDSSFEFLGFHFHLRSFKDNPHRYWVARQASLSSRKRLREKMKLCCKPHLQPKMVVSKLKSIWLGWNSYFRYGNHNRVSYRECNGLARLLWCYLKRKFRSGQGGVKWGRLHTLHEQLWREFRPVRSISDHLLEQERNLLLMGGA